MAFLEAYCVGRALPRATVKRSLTARPPTDPCPVDGAERMLWLREAKGSRSGAYERMLKSDVKHRFVIDDASLGAGLTG